ncbi:MAG: hypothetical protein IKT58_00645 [Oscillospiraceae bacterium]|nr:hypothetical protein [Oscillospiraceae bacterium]
MSFCQGFSRFVDVSCAYGEDQIPLLGIFLQILRYLMQGIKGNGAVL